MIWNGSTPTVVFRYDLDFNDTAELLVTFTQRNLPVLTLSKDRFTLHEDNILATLTQEETCLFSEGTVFAQIKATMRDGIISHSNIVSDYIALPLEQEAIQ